MSPRKPSQARYLSLRINPQTSPHEREFLRILDDMGSQGFKPKQVIVDAVLARDGLTPEMFVDGLPLPSMLIAKMERMLDEFAKHIISSIQRDGVSVVSQQVNAPNRESGKTTEFTKRFVSGLRSRSQQSED